jgi:carbonic anhydrase
MASMNFDAASARNREFAAAGGREIDARFPRLKLMVITCLDPRVDPAHFLGLGLGDAMVIRNGGGRVTREVLNEVAFVAALAAPAVAGGPIFEVAVIHHTGCATGSLADDSFRRRYAAQISVEESTLRERAVVDPVATVTRDVERLRSAGSISPRVPVSGHVYDVATGKVRTVLRPDGEPQAGEGDDEKEKA